MTLQEAMGELEALGTEAMRAFNAKHGVGVNQFGAKMGDLRGLAKKIKSDHALGIQLWETGNWDAMLLATLVLKPAQLTAAELEAMAASIPYEPWQMTSQLAEWLTSYVVKAHPAKEELRQKWMVADDPRLARVGWSLTAERVVKAPDGLDLSALLDRIEREMGSAMPFVAWTMNFVLGEIGIRAPAHRARALEIGERLGVFRDYPTSKGCTSPFAPIWIREMVARQS